MRHWPLVISIPFPGLGHILRGRFFLGIFIALGWGISLEALLLSFVWPAFLSQRVYFGLLALCIWFYAILDILRVVRKDIAWQKEGENRYRCALKKYLQGDYGDSLRDLRRLLRLKFRDIEARLLMAEVYRQMGKISRAKRALKKTKRLDETGKWHWEIEEGLSRLKGK